ncbi:MAG: hypothetical protein B6D64_05955, partial [Bacteroidetes bacterium 4484_276]
MKYLLILLFAAFLAKEGIPQLNSGYLPREYQSAYKNGTRSKDGKPGPAYWQNHSDYQIDVWVDPGTGLVDGSETISYYNNSPDTLKRIVIRLYQDIYKKGNARQFRIGESDLTDGVEISTLPQKRWIRFGQYNEGHLFTAYWYPQIAVYDDIDGWDMIDYVGAVEFYNDINNYNINITITSDFVVWATGELQNPEKVFQKEVSGRYQQALNSNDVIRIITQQDWKNGNVTKPREKNTWQFQAKNVP